jgi:YvrJ protein family
LEPGHFYNTRQKGAGAMEQMVTLISELGFPIVVTLFLLNRIEAKLDVVVSSIQGLPDRLKE